MSAVFTISGCSSDEAATVPEGVVAQYETLAEEVAEHGGQVTVDEWDIAYIVEHAEPWFEERDGQQAFRPPTGSETHHIEIVPREASTGRIVPYVPITVDVVTESGDVVDSKRLNFFYSEFFHYANNFTVPDEGTYSLRVTLDPPTFLRHGDEGGAPALATGAQTEFTGVELTHDD
ncbi:iron transporter [Hoyosella altamirensis]|uniref:Uncharacterized protein n=1 Tax=Hoyosella altamirensis TaxID=616997 RepID=A0A839RK58_9ACTN|nr:iron transporter [Hoyosella altamirensis]MBB3036689.1 hypothetical protein [Hoyosella altamirensis]